MTTTQDVVSAILAMDAYDHGYSPGMNLPNQTSIDGATIIATDGDQVAQGANFYAVAYNWNGETVISYRGTTFDGGLGPNIGDVLNGWTLGVGYSGAAQAQMAMAFYQAVYQQYANVAELTGHSLGGGMAGFISEITGTPADIFNNIPFGKGVLSYYLTGNSNSDVDDALS
jgi:hypothetical protein